MIESRWLIGVGVAILLALAGATDQSFNGRVDLTRSNRAACEQIVHARVLSANVDRALEVTSTVLADVAHQEVGREARRDEAKVIDQALVGFDGLIDPRYESFSIVGVGPVYLNPIDVAQVSALELQGQAFSCDRLYPWPSVRVLGFQIGFT